MATPSGRRQRHLWIWLHKWTGLTLGAVLALLGLTGSINVFNRELDVALNPALFAATTPMPGRAPLQASAAIRIAAHAVPEPILYALGPDPVSPVWSLLFVRGGDDWTVHVDPGSGRILGIRDSDRSLARILYRLHAELLLRPWWGEDLVGVFGLVLVFSSVSGLWLWWPRSGFWRACVRLRTRPRQILHLDLHALFGLWSALVMLLVALTGVGVVFPGLIRPAVGLVSPVAPPPAPVAMARPGPIIVDADRAVAAALSRAPTSQTGFIALPRAPSNLWQIGLRWRGVSTAWLGAGSVWVDPWTGAVVADASPGASTAGARLMDMQLWLHNGAVFGWTGRILVLLSGLALAGLYVTGLLFWTAKRRVRRRLQCARVACI